eukprot:gene6214-153_t
MTSGKKNTLYQIIEGKLYRTDCTMWNFRCQGVEHHITKAMARGLPDLEFVFDPYDHPAASNRLRQAREGPPSSDALAQSAPQHPCVFSFSKNTQYLDIVHPAWTFWAGGPCVDTEPGPHLPAAAYLSSEPALRPPPHKCLPTAHLALSDCLGRWDLKRQSMSDSASRWPWDYKVPQGFFRHDSSLLPAALGSRTSRERDPLVQLSLRRPSLVEARYTKNQSWRKKEDSMGLEPVDEVPLEDHCAFKYLFNFRGVAASFRLKHLFLCQSVVFHVGPPSWDEDWVEFFYRGLKPWVHYVPVQPDLSDAEDLLEFALGNDECALGSASGALNCAYCVSLIMVPAIYVSTQVFVPCRLMRQIADNGYNLIWEHLRDEDITDYWHSLLSQYGELVSWDVHRRADASE